MAKISLRAYNREIETMMDRGQMDEAVAHCHHILRTFPKHLDTYRLLGKLYLESKRYNDAVDIFSRVLVADPNDFVAHVGMSIIRDEESKLDDAVWHMERAFETQPSNAAIQGELQRLYGRRDGVQPPRIRMTRGALAHMYVQGELYPQAISEIKNVLQEDPGRSDVQVLLARSYYRSGQKNDAADVASALLRRYPYCLDANRVLVEILGSERPESVQVYRKRVIELDPYAAQVTGSIFQSSEVSDAAVTIEHFDWNGQPSGMQTDWGTTQAIRLESGSERNEQPDWLKNSSSETAFPPRSQPETDSFSDAMPAFDDSSASPAPQAGDDNIPDFLRAAGWGESTGTFDESKLIFQDEPEAESASAAEPIEQGDMPDWVKAMKPPEEAQPAEEEEMPDWINKIGTGDLPVPSASSSDDMPGWLDQTDDVSSSQAQSSDDQPDWMKGFGQEEQPVSPSASGDQPDWLKGFGSETEAETSPASTEQPDWLGQLEEEKEVEGVLPSERPSDEFDFLDELTSESKQPEIPPASAPVTDTGKLGTSEQEIDEALSWFESLAAKQGATEGLLTKPEDRLESEPDWIKQAKGLNASEQTVTPVAETPPMQTPPPAPMPSTNVEELGKSGQEIDDALAWFEGLAAKQGATEGLLTKPEERMEKEPDWVQKVKSAGASQPSVTPPQPISEPVSESPLPSVEPTGNLEELGKSEKEIDDALSWFEGLAAKQGATEGLLTKPEERMDKEPDWVTQAKDVDAQLQPPVPSEPEPMSTVSDTEAWLRNLDEEETAPEPAPVPMDDTNAWLKSLDEPEEETPFQPVQSDDLPAWMQNIEQENVPVAEPDAPAKEAVESSDWMGAIEEEPVVESAPVEDVPAWLGDLDKDEEPAIIASNDDLPAWLRDETGELVAEPPKIEPTRPADWKPVDEEKPEAVQTPPPVPQPALVQQVEEPEPFDQTQDKPEPAPKPKKPAAKKTEIKQATPPPPGSYREPVTRRGAGMLTMPDDPILGSARTELSRSNIPGALETYGKLIKKGRFLEEVIYDLRDALYRYPVEVSIWQTLGDAYMRANQLQDALDAYTKAEELLR
jgi:tetratricopeptide (TPR) repeat protein/uncharacterized protein Smg (DUF494 family)